MAVRVTPDTLQANWPTYRAATQMNPGDKVIVRTICAPDDQEMRQFLKRICRVRKISDFQFCEVHKYDKAWPNRVSIVIGDSNSEYPEEEEQFEEGVFACSPFHTTQEVVPEFIKPTNVDEEWVDKPVEEHSLPLYNFTLSVA